LVGRKLWKKPNVIRFDFLTFKSDAFKNSISYVALFGMSTEAIFFARFPKAKDWIFQNVSFGFIIVSPFTSRRITEKLFVITFQPPRTFRL
tara:strand:+ start:506 stop:778 length:273 start_codon:yes stop_codon:yes gene_type:complete